MREFRGYEYVDGDITIYVREKGQDDDAWKKLSTVEFGAQHHQVVQTLTREMGLNDPEQAQLQTELLLPRRW